MILITDELRTRLLANGAADAETDHHPAVKLFDPTGAATWLLTELNADGDMLFGLAISASAARNSAASALPNLKASKGRLVSASSVTSISRRGFRCRSMPRPRASPATSPRPSGCCGRQRRHFQLPIPGFRPMRRESAVRRKPSPPCRLRRRLRGQSQPKEGAKQCSLPISQSTG